MSSTRKMHFIAEIPNSVDIDALWKKVSKYQRTNIGENRGIRMLSFTGEIFDGCEVLSILCNTCDIHITVDSSFS